MEALFSFVESNTFKAVGIVYLIILTYKFLLTYTDFTFIAYVKWERGQLHDLQGNWSDLTAIRVAEWLYRMGAFSYLILMLPVIMYKQRWSFFTKRTKEELFGYACAED